MSHFELIVSWLRLRAGCHEKGASLVEYALLLALIAVVCIVAVTTMGQGLSENYDTSRTSIFGG